MQLHFFSTVLKVLLITVLTPHFSAPENNVVRRGKSLFDDLPLNGAYSAGITLPPSTPKPELILAPVKNLVAASSVAESVENSVSSKSEEGSSSNSLFDALPNQGAMMSKITEHIFESKTQKRGILSTSQDRTPDGELRFQIQLERQTPTAEFNLVDFHSNQLPSLVQAITQEEQPHKRPYTVLSPPVVPVITGPGIRVPNPNRNAIQGGYHEKPSNLYPVPARTQMRNTHVPERPSNVYPVPARNPMRNKGKETGSTGTKVSAQSGGPTVIIYATPSPSPNPPPRERPPARETHRIYHPQRQKQRHPRPQPPPPQRRNPRPLGQRHQGGYGHGRPTTPLPIPIIAGQPEQTRPPPPAAGGYPSNQPRPTWSPPSTVDPSMVSIAEAGNTPNSTPTPSNEGSADYDYETLEGLRDDEWNNFGARTGPFRFSSTFTGQHKEPSTSFRIPPEEEERTHHQHEQYLSDSYGPPPSPQPTYGPPPTLPPIQLSYGVSDPPAPAEAPAPPPPFGQSTTSISYQTIPIQTVQTQLVTVPHITVSSTSPVESESDPGFSRPQSPGRPSTAYGPPSSDSYSNNNRGRGVQNQNSQSQRGSSLFTDDQLALLISASGGSLLQNDALTLGGLGTGNNLLGPNGDAGLQLGLGGTRLGLGNNLFSNQNQQFPIRFGNNLLGNQQLQFQNQLPLRNLNLNSGPSQNQIAAALIAQQRLNGGLGASNSNSLPLLGIGGTRGGSGLSLDAADALTDLLREQRLRGTVEQLRGRLRHEGRVAQRDRQNYRSLFYKGALLLSALTLLPAVATLPGAAAAASAGVATPSFLLPITAGRRRRDVGEGPAIEKLLEMSPFEYCNQTYGSDSGKERRLGLNDWIECTSNATEKLFEQRLGESGGVTDPTSMFDAMAFKGAFVPENIRADLEKYVSPEEIVKNSECLQKRFCETVVEVQTLPKAEAFLFLYSIFASDVENNPWIREAMNAARNKSCEAFYCFEDYIKDLDLESKNELKTKQ